MTIKGLAQLMRGINIEELKVEAALKSAKIIEDSQRLQLRSGENAQEGAIGKYSPGYAKFKSTLSSYHAPMGVPDLFLTGKWQAGIKLKVKGSDYTLDSSDSKNAKLVSKYSKNGVLLGINFNQMPRVKTETTKQLGRLVKQKLKLTG